MPLFGLAYWTTPPWSTIKHNGWSISHMGPTMIWANWCDRRMIHRYSCDDQSLDVLNLPGDVWSWVVAPHDDQYVISDFWNKQIILINKDGQVKRRYKAEIHMVLNWVTHVTSSPAQTEHCYLQIMITIRCWCWIWRKMTWSRCYIRNTWDPQSVCISALITSCKSLVKTRITNIMCLCLIISQSTEGNHTNRK